MKTLLQDLRYGLRRAVAAPCLSAAIVLILALGIGANAALFSVVNGVLLRPLPLDHVDALVGTSLELSIADFFDWHAGIPAFSGLAAYNRTGLNLSARGEPQRVQVTFVSADFFPTLAVRPRQGRLFLPGEYQPGGGNVVVAAEDFWHRALGGGATALGSTLILDGKPWTLVGLVPPGFRYPKGSDLWAPYQFATGDATGARDSNFLAVVARLRPGNSLARAQMQVNTLLARLHRQYPAYNQGRRVDVVPLSEMAVQGVRPTLLVLLAAVCLVLLLACANVANLQLAVAVTRRHEIALRMALGAGRARLLRQLMTESAVLALAGAALGLLLAWGGTRALTAIIPVGQMPRWEQVGIDWRVLVYVLAIGLASSVLFGLGPALNLSAGGLYATLRSGSSGSVGDRSGRRLRDALLVFELALAVVLLASGGLALAAFHRLHTVAPGFEPDHAVAVTLNLPGREPASAAREMTVLTEMLRRVSALPEVSAASVAVGLPLSGTAIHGEFHIGGQADPERGKLPRAEYRYVGPGYLRAMGIPLLAGRDLAPSDDAAGGRVAVVNRSLAAHIWPQRDPVGQAVAVTDDDKGERRSWMRVIGVAADVHHFDLGRPPVDEIYMPLAQQPPDSLASLMALLPFTVVVRTPVAPAALARRIADTIHQVDLAQPVSDVGGLRSLVADSLARPRLEAFLLALFALLAFALAAAGTYSVTAHAVAQRTREIGLRMALGAGPGLVLRLVVVRTLRLSLAGIALGVAASWGGARLLGNLLLGVRSVDPAIVGSVAVILAVTTVAAALRPALRAAHVDPILALRHADAGGGKAANQPQ